MRLLTRPFVILLAVSALPATSAAQEPAARAAVEAAALADTLRVFAQEMAERLRARDVDAVTALYGDTLHFVHVDGGDIVPWSALAPAMRGYLASVEVNPIEVVGRPGVTLVDRDNAVVYVVLRFGGTEGRDAHEGVWTGVLHRFADGWKIVHSHSSDRGR